MSAPEKFSWVSVETSSISEISALPLPTCSSL